MTTDKNAIKKYLLNTRADHLEQESSMKTDGKKGQRSRTYIAWAKLVGVKLSERECGEVDTAAKQEKPVTKKYLINVRADHLEQLQAIAKRESTPGIEKLGASHIIRRLIEQFLSSQTEEGRQ